MINEILDKLAFHCGWAILIQLDLRNRLAVLYNTAYQTGYTQAEIDIATKEIPKLIQKDNDKMRILNHSSKIPNKIKLWAIAYGIPFEQYVELCRHLETE